MTSYELMKLCVRFDLGCSYSSAKAILIALASWYVEGVGDAEGMGYARRGVRALSIDASCHRSTIAPAIRWLEENGVIQKRAGERGHRAYYQFNIGLLRAGKIAKVSCGGTEVRTGTENRTMPVRNTVPEAVLRTAPREKEEKKREKRAREAASSFLEHDQVDMSKLWCWSRQLIQIPEVKKKVLESFDKGDGTVHLDAFVTALYTTRRVYEQYRPWLEKLAREGRL